jgi:hypothetical protein
MGNNNTRTQRDVDEAEVRRRVELEIKRARRRDARTLRRVVSLVAVGPMVLNMLHEHQYQGGLAITAGVLFYLGSRADNTFRSSIQGVWTLLSAVICVLTLLTEMAASTITDSAPAVSQFLHWVGYLGEFAFLVFHGCGLHVCNEAELK